MNAVAIIPARMGSSRFPGKPMAKILGMPMIGHVYLRSARAKTISDCWVATCDDEIKDYIESIGGKAVMTSKTHERASGRTAEAMQKIEEITGKTIDIAVMIQGDEPLVTPSMIDESVMALKHSDAGVACLMTNIRSDEEFNDPNEIKVVVDRNFRALYMSREPIPTARRGVTPEQRLKQVCIIPFTRDYLLRFNALEPALLEISESIDLNRCLEHGDPVQMAFDDSLMISVDTPEDLKRAEEAMKNDFIFQNFPYDPEKSAVA